MDKVQKPISTQTHFTVQNANTYNILTSMYRLQNYILLPDGAGRPAASVAAATITNSYGPGM
jgi:hypothetical protein